MRRPKPRAKAEPVISLINIVFLILIFFMVAGTLAQPGRGIEFVQTTGLECCSDPDALAISIDGTLSYRGEPVLEVEAYLSSLDSPNPLVRLLPDQSLPATELLRIIAKFKSAGVERVVILTEAQSA